MRSIGFVDLLTMKDLNISSIFAMNQLWEAGSSFVKKTPRKQNAFLWFCGTSGRFRLEDGKTLTVPCGALAYIPQGATYEILFCEEAGAVSTVLVEFCVSDGEPFALAKQITLMELTGKDLTITQLMEKIVSEYERPAKPWLKLRRDLLELLYLVATREEKKGIHHCSFKTIEKGIVYLQKDEKQALSVEEIAQMCFVTPAYFRKLFREYAGVSPTVYRTQKKIDRAKALFEHADLSVGEVSERLGYADPSYFCRAFKRETGVTPMEYKNQLASKQNDIEKRKNYGKDPSSCME